MNLAQVIGYATATVKHPSMNGWRLLVVQPMNGSRQADGDPLIAIDALGAAPTQEVIVCLEGRATRQMLGDEHAPVRCCIVGLCDSPKG